MLLLIEYKFKRDFSKEVINVYKAYIIEFRNYFLRECGEYVLTRGLALDLKITYILTQDKLLKIKK